MVDLPQPPLELATRIFSMSLSPRGQKSWQAYIASAERESVAASASASMCRRCALADPAAPRRDRWRLPAGRRIGRQCAGCAATRSPWPARCVASLQQIHVGLRQCLLARKTRAEFEKLLLLPGRGALARAQHVARRCRRAAGSSRCRNRPPANGRCRRIRAGARSPGSRAISARPGHRPAWQTSTEALIVRQESTADAGRKIHARGRRVDALTEHIVRHRQGLQRADRRRARSARPVIVESLRLRHARQHGARLARDPFRRAAPAARQRRCRRRPPRSFCGHRSRRTRRALRRAFEKRRNPPDQRRCRRRISARA